MMDLNLSTTWLETSPPRKGNNFEKQEILLFADRTLSKTREIVDATNGNNEDESTGTTASSNGSSGFPCKLYQMLEDAEVRGFDHIVSWLPCGTGLKVHSQKDFEAKGIMSHYFQKQTRYKSFQKQLNLYRFTRSTNGAKKGSYSHSLFRRGRMDLCKLISRPGNATSINQNKREMTKNFSAASTTTAVVAVAAAAQQQARDVIFGSRNAINDTSDADGDENGNEDLLEVLAEEVHKLSSTSSVAGAFSLSDSNFDARNENRNIGSSTSAGATMMTKVPQDIIDEIIFTFGSPMTPYAV